MSRLCFLLLFASAPALAQIAPEKVAMDRMEKKGKWPRVEQGFRKSLSKDSINPETRYNLSLYYFAQGNPSRNLDSAYKYSKSSLRSLQFLPPKERDRLRRVPLDSTLLLRLISGIDSASFEKVKSQNTEVAYQNFIDRHKTASQRSAAIELRDEVAFLEALKINTWNSFQKFIGKYPLSHRKVEAQGRYEKLLYDDKTTDRRLSSYIKFHKQFPESPYRSQAEISIFELSTASGSKESFKWFLANYPSGKSSARAKNILYRLQSGDEEDLFNDSWMTDSLRTVEQLNRSYWVAIFKSGKYGFIDEHGTDVITPAFDMIADDYRCGDIHDRVLVTSSGLISRNGKRLWSGSVSEAKEIGSGYLLLTTDSGRYVIHESGFRVGSRISEAQVVVNRLIGLERNKKWAIYSLAGKSLLPFVYDGITSFDSLIVLIKGEKKIITTPARIGRLTEKVSLPEDKVFDDVRRWGPQQYWVRIGLLEGVVDANLNFIIPLDRQQLRKTPFGFVRAKDGQMFIKGIPRFENITYKAVTVQAGWVQMQTQEGKYQVYDKGLDRLASGDSAWFQGQLAFLQSKDSLKAYLPSGQRLSFPRSVAFQIKEYRDSSTWLILDDKKRKVVYDAVSGIKLFTMEFEQIEAVSPEIFLITRQNKKGLLTEEGKVLVPIEYDAIVVTEPNGFSLLKEKKFGWYDAVKKQLVKPIFDRNIKSYNKSLRMAFKDNGYGFIHPDGKPLGNFEWEDVVYWNDSTAIVKKNFQWMVIDINSGKTKIDRIRNYTAVKDTPLEKIYIVRQDNTFGVISNKRGVIVPMQYSDVVNLGNSETQLYFTERHIEEAGISVVVYFDHNGKIIRKQAMEAEEFDKIYCDN